MHRPIEDGRRKGKDDPAPGEAKGLIGTFWPVASSSSGNQSRFRFWIEHGQSGRLCDLCPNRRLRCLDPYCRPKLQRARFMDLRRSHPHSDWPLERFLRHLKIHPLSGWFRALAIALHRKLRLDDERVGGS